MMILLLLIIIPQGIFQIICPEQACMMGKRWRYKGEVEPSDLMIALTRIGGIILICIGIIICVCLL